jgi:hypothetical protein
MQEMNWLILEHEVLALLPWIPDHRPVLIIFWFLFRTVLGRETGG